MGDKPKERPENDPSRLFGGAVNTTAQGHPIQICYGEVEVGSAIISTMIDYTYKSHESHEGGVGSSPQCRHELVRQYDPDAGKSYAVCRLCGERSGEQSGQIVIQ
jgi:hypothetical protein